MSFSLAVYKLFADCLRNLVDRREIVQIRVAAQTAVLVKQLRVAWDALMERKVQMPTKPLDAKQQKILDTIVSLVREDAKSSR